MSNEKTFHNQLGTAEAHIYMKLVIVRLHDLQTLCICCVR